MSRRSTVVRLLLTGLAVPLALLAATLPAQTSSAAGPPAPNRQYTRVMMIVLDQLRPEFIDAFDMQNVKRLMAGGTSYKDAYLGHMGSETVVSHNVMTSGQLPKHMGWADEWYRDVDGVLGPQNGRYVSGSMGVSQFDALISHRGYPKLADYLHQAFGQDRKVATIGEKNYAVYSMGGPGADMRITFGSANADCDGDPTVATRWRGPTGPGVPEYIRGTASPSDPPSCNKYYVDSTSSLDYGTTTTSPAWMYPLAGNRDFPGFDPDHQGGDVWVGNAAVDVMDHEDWSGLLLTFGGIDKAGHMWGGLNDVPPYPSGEPGKPTAIDAVHMANMAKIADQQVGRMMSELDRRGLLDETLVVLTTDHAQQHAVAHYGIDALNRGNFNWYYGRGQGTEAYLDPQPEIQKLIQGTHDNVEMSMQDTAIRTWLTDHSVSRMQEAADVMATLAGVRATYYRVGDHYLLRTQDPQSEFAPDEWEWYVDHAQEIVDTEAADYGPDVIGLLADDTSYGVEGDHGGAQEAVQRIPIVFSGPGVKAGHAPGTPLRSVDILPTVLRELGIAPTHTMDGHGYPLP